MRAEFGTTAGALISHLADVTPGGRAELVEWVGWHIGREIRLYGGGRTFPLAPRKGTGEGNHHVTLSQAVLRVILDWVGQFSTRMHLYVYATRGALVIFRGDNVLSLPVKRQDINGYPCNVVQVPEASVPMGEILERIPVAAEPTPKCAEKGCGQPILPDATAQYGYRHMGATVAHKAMRVPRINSGIPHVFVPKAEGTEGGPSYCIAPCHGHITSPQHMIMTAESLALILPDGTRYEARQPLDKFGKPAVDMTTCGTCWFTWNDALITSVTPVPSGRCPNEYGHQEEEEEEECAEVISLPDAVCISATEERGTGTWEIHLFRYPTHVQRIDIMHGPGTSGELHTHDGDVLTFWPMTAGYDLERVRSDVTKSVRQLGPIYGHVEIIEHSRIPQPPQWRPCGRHRAELAKWEFGPFNPRPANITYDITRHQLRTIADICRAGRFCGLAPDELTFRLSLTLNVQAWCDEYGVTPEEVRDMAEEDVRQWVLGDFTAAKWNGLVRDVNVDGYAMDSDGNITREGN